MGEVSDVRVLEDIGDADIDFQAFGYLVGESVGADGISANPEEVIVHAYVCVVEHFAKNGQEYFLHPVFRRYERTGVAGSFSCHLKQMFFIDLSIDRQR